MCVSFAVHNLPPEDASQCLTPIRPEKVIKEMNSFYTLTVYEGRWFRMIHTLLGEDGFQKGMKLYFGTSRRTAATCKDFVAAMEDARC
ncbi:M1 family aminopeptidase [Vibrio chagasii]|nr:M1 family aminopeptidase [Vibrio chagasii]